MITGEKLLIFTRKKMFVCEFNDQFEIKQQNIGIFYESTEQIIKCFKEFPFKQQRLTNNI